MATARDIVTRTLRLLGVIEAGEDPSAEDAQTGLDALNDMLHGWRNEGIDLQHVTAALTDTLRVDDSYLEGIRYNLAVRLQPEFGVTLAPAVVARATATLAAFRAKKLEFDDFLRVDRALHPRYFGNRRPGAFDIDEG